MKIKLPAAGYRLFSVEPIVFTPLGYPADQPGPKERQPLSDLVRYERW